MHASGDYAIAQIGRPERRGARRRIMRPQNHEPRQTAQ